MPSLPPNLSGLPPDTARHVINEWTDINRPLPNFAPTSYVATTALPLPALRRVRQTAKFLVIGRLAAMLIAFILFLFIFFLLR